MLEPSRFLVLAQLARYLWIGSAYPWLLQDDLYTYQQASTPVLTPVFADSSFHVS